MNHSKKALHSTHFIVLRDEMLHSTFTTYHFIIFEIKINKVWNGQARSSSYQPNGLDKLSKLRQLSVLGKLGELDGTNKSGGEEAPSGQGELG